jgi:hypothetical protein
MLQSIWIFYGARQKRQAIALVAQSWWRDLQDGEHNNNMLKNEQVSSIIALCKLDWRPPCGSFKCWLCLLSCQRCLQNSRCSYKCNLTAMVLMLVTLETMRSPINTWFMQGYCILCPDQNKLCSIEFPMFVYLVLIWTVSYYVMHTDKIQSPILFVW